MLASEFSRFCDRFIEDWAQDLSKVDDLEISIARQEATRRTKDDFAEGVDGEGRRLFVISADDKAVGTLWFSFEGTRAFIQDITIEPDKRGRGYGRRALILMEAELEGLGVSRVQLSVDAQNPRAKALYERVGYAVTGFRLTKRLGAG